MSKAFVLLEGRQPLSQKTHFELILFGGAVAPPYRTSEGDVNLSTQAVNTVGQVLSEAGNMMGGVSR